MQIDPSAGCASSCIGARCFPGQVVLSLAPVVNVICIGSSYIKALSSFVKFAKFFAKFSAVESERIVYTAVHVSLEKEKENLCVVFTYSIKQAHEIRKFHVAFMNNGSEMYKN